MRRPKRRLGEVTQGFDLDGVGPADGPSRTACVRALGAQVHGVPIEPDASRGIGTDVGDGPRRRNLEGHMTEADGAEPDLYGARSGLGGERRAQYSDRGGQLHRTPDRHGSKDSHPFPQSAVGAKP